MQANVMNVGTNDRDRELDEELVGMLTAISIVSKRLAKKLSVLQDTLQNEGGENDAGK